MKERIKWALVGFGFMFGLQILIGQVVRLFSNTSDNPDAYYIIIVGLTLGTFLVGGMIIGLMLDEIAIAESVGAAIAALVLNALLSLSNVGVSHNPLFFGQSSVGWSVVVAVVAVVLAIGGALIGERINTPQSDTLSSALLIIGLLAVIVGPYVLLIREVPGRAIAIVGVILLVAIAVALWLFTHERSPVEDVSISPDRRKRG
ncbi:MAG TPA: hypothetical protein VFC63_11935 [Blastocatellia bacterium]|nr:hypothetical protein [Blastocatellia bacterium]